MHKRAKATARRQLLTSPPKNGAGTFAGGSFGQEPPSFLSPVSSCARKLQLQRWGDSPRVSGGFGAGHVGQNGTHTASSTPVTHTPALFGCGTGTFQARSLEPTPLPGGYHPVPNARRDIDTQPIRSEQGLTFAEMLAVNANANAAGASCTVFGKRKAEAILHNGHTAHHPTSHSRFVTREEQQSNPPMTAPNDGKHGKPFGSRNFTRETQNVPPPNLFSTQNLSAMVHIPTERERSYRTEPVYRGGGHCSARSDQGSGGTTPENENTKNENTDCEIPHLPGLDGVPAIAGSTLKSLLSGNGVFETHVLDVRFPHEFRAGHVIGSSLCPDPIAVQRYLIEALCCGKLGAGPVAKKKPNRQKVFVFVCDRGADKSPQIWRHVRSLDRKTHIASYPHLSVPNMFVLERGFECFVQTHQGWCTGPAVPANAPLFDEERARAASCWRESWRVASHASGLTLVPDSESVRQVSAMQKREQRRVEEWWGDEAEMRE